MSNYKKTYSSPRIKVIQKVYSHLLNPGEKIDYPKSQYKKFIKDVVSGTLERLELIEETINRNLSDDIDLKTNLAKSGSSRSVGETVAFFS